MKKRNFFFVCPECYKKELYDGLGDITHDLCKNELRLSGGVDEFRDRVRVAMEQKTSTLIMLDAVSPGISTLAQLTKIA